MAAEVLIDTGAILALIDKSDDWHDVCTAVVSELPLPMLTSEAVLTELFHLAGENPAKKESAWRFLREGIIVLATIEHPELQHIDALMSRYRDRPMDFPDATLVYLAERESLEAIFTVDQTDFTIYRIGGKRRFQIIPSHGPDSLV
jgi:predicted nucleic acid-binding protein